VAFSVGEKLSGKFSQAALEFSSFFFIQRVLLKRLQQGFGGRDKDEYIGSKRHDGDPAECRCDQCTDSRVGGSLTA